MKVIIDNGHGEETKGKRSPDESIREYAYARKVKKELIKRLEAEGIECVDLVPEECDISLGERCRRANAAANGVHDILISIHLNAAGNGDWMNARGWEAYSSPGRTKADDLAEELYKSAEKHLPSHRIRTDMSDGDSDKEARFYILRKTKCPAVLTENLFQDNKEDVAFLLSDEGFNAIVDLHVEGIKNYIEKFTK